jgi:hypothetical protein
MTMKKVIVTRHPAALEFLSWVLDGFLCRASNGGERLFPPDGKDATHLCRRVWDLDLGDGELTWRVGELIPIVAHAGPEDVQGAVVYGNLPLHLAALAAEVHVIEFSGNPPRGQEYTFAQMEAAGARLSRYIVCDVARVKQIQDIGETYSIPRSCLIGFDGR